MAASTPFVTRACHELENSVEGAFKFTILQWNVLADYLSTTQSFQFVDPEVLQWKNRCANQLAIILENDYDFVSLQEVDHYHDFLLPNLQKKGFGGLYKKKVGTNLDGSALFYRADRFDLVEHKLFEYGSGSHVAIFAHFLPKSSDKDKSKSGVCLVTTHLKAGLGFEAVRSKQMNKLLKAVEKFNERAWPVVLAMDGNDFPVSDVINYATKGQCESEGKTYTNDYMLLSAYDLDAKSGTRSVPFTTYKKRETEVLRTIDYILYRHGKDSKLIVTGLQEIPPIEKFPKRLPATDYPSDHLSIGAKFVVAAKL
jgi:mRNA deadenylase 3'-5' endonuclease subunit Ccr4